MKRFYTLIMLLSFSIATFTGCGIGRKTNRSTIGGTVVKTVATVVGFILLSKLIKSVLKTVIGSKSLTGLAPDQNFTDNITEDTKLNTFVKNDVMKSALQVVLAERYQIPLATVTSNYNSLNTFGDLATFIGQNASAKALMEIK